MHMAHFSGNPSGVSKSSSDWLNYTGFPGDMCVVFFNVPPGNKDAVTPNPLRKEESRHVYKCDDKIWSGSNKCWNFKSMWNIQSSQHRIFKIRPRVLHTVIVATFPRPETWRWMKRTVIGCLTCRSNGLMGGALANESCHLFQTFSRQSEGLAMRDYLLAPWKLL